MSFLKKKSSGEIHYFLTNNEYRSYPEYTNLVFRKISPMRFSPIILLTQYAQNLLFFLICKSGSSNLFLSALIIFIVLAGLSSFTGRHIHEVRSKTSLAFMGLLDIVYFFILIYSGNHLNSYVFATQLQTTLLIRVILLKFILVETFNFTQYIGAMIILAATILAFIYYGDKYVYLFLLGIVLHCINGIIKRHYLKKFKVHPLAMNKYVLMFSAGFGIIFLPMIGLLSNDLTSSLNKEFSCLVGIDCFLMPLYLALLILASVSHAVVLSKSEKEPRQLKFFYMFSSLTAFLGFFTAELILGDGGFDLIRLSFTVLAICGSIIYHIYPEIPLKFSYSD